MTYSNTKSCLKSYAKHHETPSKLILTKTTFLYYEVTLVSNILHPYRRCNDKFAAISAESIFNASIMRALHFFQIFGNRKLSVKKTRRFWSHSVKL